VTLKQAVIKGFTWSFVDSLVQTGLAFVVGIVLARLLSPAEFGLVGMITIFISVSGSFVDSGFGNALVRKKECTDLDYSTVFYFNLAVGIVFYWVLFFCAPDISRFFNEPRLTKLIQVLSIVLVINSFALVQQTILTRRIDFKLQARISLIASLVSGLIGIVLAFIGFGVWSLVVRQICHSGIKSALFWVWNRWRPVFAFSRASFAELFSFGYKLLLSGLIDTVYQNIYLLIIGKFFSAQDLGYFTRARQFQSLPSENINNVVRRVSYPVLARMQDDKAALKKNYQKLLKGVMFVTFVLMLGMGAVAEPMVITLIGEPWRPCIVYVQLLCLVGMMYPLHALNLNILNVHGRSDLFLRLAVIKKILALPVIVIGVMFGIEAMIIGMIVNSQIACFLNGHWSGRFIGYPIREQAKDILPSFVLAGGMALVVALIGQLIAFSPPAVLMIQVVSGAVLVLVIARLIKLEAYQLILETVFARQA
jgi:O-antigen/teichoic acid export membrane protein